MARFVIITLVIAACGGDDGGGGNGGNPDGQPQPAEELSCKSIALCTTFDVKTFLGTVSTPTGGTLKNGLYKFAYEIRPDNVNEDGGYTEDLEALVISGNQYNWAGLFRNELGTLTVSGTTATFQATRRCERGTDQGESTNKLEYPFTATDREIHLFSHVTRSDGVEWDDEQVYLRVDDPSTVCNAVANEPSTPGDSVQCRVTNCACSFAVNDTVAECN